MHVVVDARKGFDSGIGTYIRHVVPRVVALMPDARFSALVPEGHAEAHDYLDTRRVERIEVAAKPLGAAEQFALRTRVPRDATLWATSLAHPLLTRRPLVATVHDVAQLALKGAGGGSGLVRALSRAYFASIRSRAGLLIFNSAFTRDEYTRHVGIRAGQRALVTPLGVDPSWFVRPDRLPTPARRYFVCVGNVRPHKNLRLVLSAFAKVVDEVDHDLVVIGQHQGFRTGDPGLLQEMQALGERVRFTGFLSDADLRRQVAGAEALVFPSLYEGFGLPVLEAMAIGCPVISSSAASLPEVGGDAARYFDPQDAGALARRLVEVARLGADEKASTVADGISRARTFTWDRTAQLTAEALETLSSRP